MNKEKVINWRGQKGEVKKRRKVWEIQQMARVGVKKTEDEVSNTAAEWGLKWKKKLRHTPVHRVTWLSEETRRKVSTVEARRRRRRGPEEEEARGSTLKMAAVSSASDTGKCLFFFHPPPEQVPHHQPSFGHTASQGTIGSVSFSVSSKWGNCCSAWN